MLPAAMRAAKLITRLDDRGATMVVVSPPLVAGEAVLGELVDALDRVVGAAETWLRR